MLMWKTTSSPSVRSETVRRPQLRVRRVPREIRKVSRTANHDLAPSSEVREYRTSRDDEKRYIVKLVLMMLLLIVLPAVLVLLYLFFAPEAIQYDIVLEQDFSSWYAQTKL